MYQIRYDFIISFRYIMNIVNYIVYVYVYVVNGRIAIARM
jgi:hypothetical protein